MWGGGGGGGGGGDSGLNTATKLSYNPLWAKFVLYRKMLIETIE